MTIDRVGSAAFKVERTSLSPVESADMTRSLPLPVLTLNGNAGRSSNSTSTQS